jgi:integrase
LAAGGLRSYLRYRSTRGDAVGPLRAVIASPAHWTLAHLPQALTREEVARLLDDCREVRRWPKRGYAIVRCALELGLRAGEIAHLIIGDIDWRAGTLTLRGTKSLRQDVLPLPVETGEALADYLLNERPRCASSAVFVRHLSPRDLPMTSRAVQTVITRVFPRSGLPYSGAHVLRHTFAVRRLIQWHREGSDLDQKMLALSTYLGHTEIGCSYWYLSAVPELMALAGAKFERFAMLGERPDA